MSQKIALLLLGITICSAMILVYIFWLRWLWLSYRRARVARQLRSRFEGESDEEIWSNAHHPAPIERAEADYLSRRWPA